MKNKLKIFLVAVFAAAVIFAPLGAKNAFAQEATVNFHPDIVALEDMNFQMSCPHTLTITATAMRTNNMFTPVAFGGLHIDGLDYGYHPFSIGINNLTQTILPGGQFHIAAPTGGFFYGRPCPIHGLPPWATSSIEILATGPISGGTWDFTITVTSNTEIFGFSAQPRIAFGEIILSAV